MARLPPTQWNSTRTRDRATDKTNPTPPAIIGTTSRNIQQRQKKHPTRKRQTEAPKNPHPRNARVSPTRAYPK